MLVRLGARARRYVDLGSPASLILLFAAVALGLKWAWLTYAMPTDFQAFVDAADALAAGANPYGVYTIQFDVPYPNLNPPSSLFFIRPLAAADPVVAHQVWFWACVAGYAANILFLRRLAPARATLAHAVWLVALTGFWHTLESKNLYVVLGLGVTVVWLLLRSGRTTAAGVLIGLLVALKPNLIVWPVLLVLAGHWRLGVTAGAVTAAASLFAFFEFGSVAYRQWLEAVELYSRPVLPHNGSLVGAAARVGVPWVGTAASAVLLGAVGLLAIVRRPSAGDAGALAIVAALLAAPVAWVGYSLLLLPALMERRWGRPLAAAAVLLVAPAPLVTLAATWSPVWLASIGSTYSAAYLLVLVGLVRAASPVGATQFGTFSPLFAQRTLSTLRPAWERCVADGWMGTGLASARGWARRTVAVRGRSGRLLAGRGAD